MMKRAIMFGVGLIWLMFALGFGFFLVEYITDGAGFQFFGSVGLSGGVLLGLVQFVGICTAILICFAVGAGLCARAMLGESRSGEENSRRA